MLLMAVACSCFFVREFGFFCVASHGNSRFRSMGFRFGFMLSVSVKRLAFNMGGGGVIGYDPCPTLKKKPEKSPTFFMATYSSICAIPTNTVDRAFPDGLQQTVFPCIPMGIPSAQQSRLQQTVFPCGNTWIYSLENLEIMVFPSLYIYIYLGNTNGNTWEYVGIRVFIPTVLFGTTIISYSGSVPPEISP